MMRPKATTTPSGTSASHDVVDVVRDREAELERGRLHGRRAEPAPPPPSPVGLGHDERHLDARVDEGAERRDGQVGRAEVGDPPDRTDRRDGEAQRSRVTEG